MDDARREDVPRSGFVNAVKRRLYQNVDTVIIPARSHTESCTASGLPRKKMFYGLNVVDNDWFAQRADAVRRRRDSSRPDSGLPQRCVPRCRAPGEEELGHSGHGLRGLLLSCPHRPVGPGVCRRRPRTRISGESGRRRQCGCSDELVEEGRNGWTFDPDDCEESAARMCEFAQWSDARRAEMGARSREIIARWPIESFAPGALAAIDSCRAVSCGFATPLDRFVTSLWKGRYRPT